MIFCNTLNFEKLDLTNKVALVTGANIGLGLETARYLASMNAKVFIACRSNEKALKAQESILETTNNKVEVLHLDLSKFSSVKKCAEEFIQTGLNLDILINNAGLVNTKLNITEDGFENTLQCNYFSPTLLTLLLLPSLKRSSAPRVVNVASDAYNFGTFDLNNLKGLSYENYSSMGVYGTSKLYFILLTQMWAQCLKDNKITFVATHPGFVDTDIGKKEEIQKLWYYWILKPFIYLGSWLFARTPQKAAITSVHAAIQPNVIKSGSYYASCSEFDPKISLPEGSKQLLWEKTLSLLDWDPKNI